MEKIKIRMIEQLNNVVAQAEKVLTTENFSDASCFDLMNREVEKFIEITNELKHAVFPENNIENNILNLKNTLLQLQQKVAVVETADEPNHSEDTEVATTVEIEQPVLDFVVTEASVVEAPIVAEAPVVEKIPVVAEASIVAETPAVAEKSHLLDRLRSLSEEGKSENISALSAMVDKLRTTPPMPEVHLEHPIDLRTSIGINEKFLFVNELFSGSIREFNEAMSLLNNLDDLESAMAQIHIYREKLDWNEDSIAYMTLEDMVNQRFSQLVTA
jgi:hypothetical protein